MFNIPVPKPGWRLARTGDLILRGASACWMDEFQVWGYKDKPGFDNQVEFKLDWDMFWVAVNIARCGP